MLWLLLKVMILATSEDTVQWGRALAAELAEGSVIALVGGLGAGKTHAVKGFTAKYNVDRLVYFETFETPDSAIAREKRLKKWHRAWKVALIERDNPHWRDLAEEFVP